MQLTINTNPHIGELELHEFAHNVNAAVLGWQADFDMWILRLKTAAHQTAA